MAAPVTRGGMRQVWLKFRCFATSNIGFGKFGLVVFGVQGNIFLLAFWEQGTIGGYPVRPPSGSDGRCFLWGGLELRWETPLQLCQHQRVQADTDTMQLKLGEAKALIFFPLNSEKVQVSKSNLEKEEWIFLWQVCAMSKLAKWRCQKLGDFGTSEPGRAWCL